MVCGSRQSEKPASPLSKILSIEKICTIETLAPRTLMMGTIIRIVSTTVNYGTAKRRISNIGLKIEERSHSQRRKIYWRMSLL